MKRSILELGPAAILGGLLLLAFAPASARAQSATQELEDHLAQNRCTSTKTTACLTVLTNDACASGCFRRGYSWTANATDERRYRIDLHMTNGYLRLLRNAFFEAPDYVLRDGLSFGNTLRDLLYYQIEMFLHDRSAEYYDGLLQRLSPTKVVDASHSVDPTRFWMLAFGNESGAAQAMAQADFASWLLSLATGSAKVGEPQRVDYYLRLSEAVFRSFAVRFDDGGVRNNKKSYRCYGTQYCYWFHSFVAGSTGSPQSVLNQNLHAIRDALTAHETLIRWRDQPINGVPLPVEFATNGHIEVLRDLGRGGLNQLVYGLGNAADYTAPPNLADFMQNNQMDPQDPSVKRYNAYYRFDMNARCGANGSTAGNVCHYHYHNLELFRSILTIISTSSYYKSDPDFVALYYKLLYGRSSGDTRSCNNRYSIPASKKLMRGIPLAEFYYGGLVYETRPTSSSFPYGHCDDALWFQAPEFFHQDPDAAGMIETREFFDTAYGGCRF